MSKFKVGDIVYYENYDEQIQFLALIIKVTESLAQYHYLRLLAVSRSYNLKFIGKIGYANEQFLRHIND